MEKKVTTQVSVGKFCKTGKGLLLAFGLALTAWPDMSAASGGIQIGRLKVAASFSAAATTTDNLFLTEDDKKSELITNLSPELAFYFSLSPDNETSLKYRGNFKNYRDYDRFNKESHIVDAAWSLRQPLGSRFRLKAGIEDSALRPYDESDNDKEYLVTNAAMDSEIRISDITGFDLGYAFKQRRFDEEVDEADEYDRHRARAGIIYDRFALTSLVAQYSYELQDNNDPDSLSTDMYTHTLLAGIRRKQTARLSGDFMVGYTWTEVEDFNDFSGVAFNANLTYALTELSRLKLTVDRQVVHSTIAERETNIYYDSTRGALDLTINRWDKFGIGGSVSFRNKEYQGSTEEDGDRSDDLLGIILRSHYNITSWFRISGEYQYLNNDSNTETYSYEENSALARLTLSL